MPGARRHGRYRNPLHIQVATKIAFLFGSSGEERINSHIFVRADAFSSRACLDRSFGPLHIGMPVRGVLELAERGYCSAHLVGWCTFPNPALFHHFRKSFPDLGCFRCAPTAFAERSLDRLPIGMAVWSFARKAFSI